MLDFADTRALKKLYNYNLVSMRQIMELEQEVAFDFRTEKVYPNPKTEFLMK